MNIRLLALLSEQQSSVKSQLDAIQIEAEKLSSSSGKELKELRDGVSSLLAALKIEDNASSDSSSSDEDEETEQDHLFESLDIILARLSKLEDAVHVIPKETRVL